MTKLSYALPALATLAIGVSTLQSAGDFGDVTVIAATTATVTTAARTCASMSATAAASRMVSPQLPW